MFQTGGTEIGVSDFPSLSFVWLWFVSDFDIRISDLIADGSSS